MNSIAPLSVSQVEYLKRTVKAWLNVAEGGYRGGKNVLNTLAFCIALENHPDNVHLIAGVSNATAKLNIIECDGFGLLNFFEGRCREGKFKDRDCLYVNTKTGEKVVLVSGGGKKGDEKLIKGNTYGMVYITEANECTKDFLNMAISRTLSKEKRKIFMDLNPKQPKHWFYEEFLNIHDEKQKQDKDYGYNYGHFTICDNLSVSDKTLKQIISTYDTTSVLYKRDIKGLRLSADGLIYQVLADRPNDFIIDEAPKDIATIILGVDFGGNGSLHSFTATALTYNLKEVVVLKSKRVPSVNTSPTDLYREFCNFAREVYDKYHYSMFCNCDSAEQTLINGIRIESANQRLPVTIQNASKKKIIDRIRLVCTLLAQNRLKFIKGECNSLIEALSTAVWNTETSSGNDERLDNGTTDIDSLDSFEYTIEKYSSDLIKVGLK